MPGWAKEASPAIAFRRGVVVAFSVPGLVLFSTALGFGALARDGGFTTGQAVFLSFTVFALPNQVVLIDQLARGATLAAVALAVTLTGIRLLPMTVSLLPLIREERPYRAVDIARVHLVVVTTWLESNRRLPRLPPALRGPHFVGIGLAMASLTVGGTVAGHALAQSLPTTLAAALLFMNPLYFLLSLIATSRVRMDLIAVTLGCVLGPILYLLAPGLDLLASGLIGGTLAFFIVRRL
jgi:predicted branched-subunit amino acid permease